MKKIISIICVLSLPLCSISAFAAKSPLREILPSISEIKDQKGRNTCTIFTTIATLETLYIQSGGSNRVDLSEEWLQYLGSITNASGGARGSMVSTDFSNAKRWGIPTE